MLFVRYRQARTEEAHLQKSYTHQWPEKRSWNPCPEGQDVRLISRAARAAVENAAWRL